MLVPAIWREWFSQENKRTDYDSRRTWDSGLDAGSTPARSINFPKEGSAEGGKNPYEARRRMRTEFAFECVCSAKVKQVEFCI